MLWAEKETGDALIGRSCFCDGPHPPAGHPTPNQPQTKKKKNSGAVIRPERRCLGRKFEAGFSSLAPISSARCAASAAAFSLKPSIKCKARPARCSVTASAVVKFLSAYLWAHLQQHLRLRNTAGSRRSPVPRPNRRQHCYRPSHKLPGGLLLSRYQMRSMW